MKRLLVYLFIVFGLGLIFGVNANADDDIKKLASDIKYHVDYYKDSKNLSIFKCKKPSFSKKNIGQSLSSESYSGGVNRFKAKFMNKEKRDKFQNLFDDYVVIYEEIAGIGEVDPKFFVKKSFKKNEKNLYFSPNSFSLYPLFNMSKTNAKSFFTFNASPIYKISGNSRHRSSRDINQSDVLTVYEFNSSSDSSIQKITSHMYFPGYHRNMSNLAYYFDNNYNGVNDHKIYDVIKNIKNDVFKLKNSNYVGISSYQICDKIYFSKNPKQNNEKKNLEDVIPKELISKKKDGEIFLKGNSKIYNISPLEKCDSNLTIWTNCIADYEMSNAPQEIYNDLVEANNVVFYRGELKNNYPHGVGILHFKDGTNTFVIFDNGQLKKLTSYEGAKGYMIRELIELSLKKEKTKIFEPKPGYAICRSVWKQLISIRNTKNIDTFGYEKINAYLETAFDLMLAYKGTNALDYGNCEKLLSLSLAN